ncbi:Mu-like prophage tail sheath protein gpL [Humidesulfovibrio mexicanus]|uniref:Mu-like prophage tail sheath protein gpL n=1 Tax=Humidesulfovibrio mexicanus TaxID=147047 RepID=A0A239BES3_9BACT|nr:phage tail sheath subtilisin-like domain-containing protein [Humidesulfovibrio mexicanus]SNS05584.1 Mu-like prophage tail sheath protein gpL [Humidesulfovibrio mexicanus]
MNISFNSLSENVRIPLAYVEFDNSKAVTGTPEASYKVLFIGQKLAEGTGAALVPTRITSAAQSEALHGRGSMLAAMFRAAKAADRWLETWAIALDDSVSGVAATGSLLLTGPAIASGVVNLYVGGALVRIAVTAGDSAQSIAAALAAAINADGEQPLVAAINGTTPAQVDLTCRWKGATGNDIDLRLNYHTGEALPAGVGVAITAMHGGAGDPDIADAVAVMGNEWWRAIVTPYTDTANLDALDAELLDRWGPMRQMEGIAYAAVRGTLAQTSTWGLARNSQLQTCMGTGKSPTPPWIFAADYGVQAAKSLSADPARPLQTLVLPSCLPPAVEDRWDDPERNLLLFDGVATYNVNAAGKCCIEREVTTYRVNAYGLPDPSYLDIQTPATLGYWRYAVRARITQKYPRHKLAKDGTRFGPGQAIVTPSIIRDELFVLFRELELEGLVEDFDAFKEALLVERNANSQTRVDVLATPDLVNQFRMFAMLTQFIL